MSERDMFEKEIVAAEQNFEKLVDFLNNYCDEKMKVLLAQESLLERTSVLTEHQQIIREKLEATA